MIKHKLSPTTRKHQFGSTVPFLIICVALIIGLIPLIADTRPNGLTVLSLALLSAALILHTYRSTR